MLNEHDLAVEAVELRRSFGATNAVDGVDLRVQRGAVHGVLGPNGAGKTTLIRMLATLLRPDAGSARVCGFDVVQDADEVRSRVSLTGQFAAVDGDLTGLENLILVGRLLGLSRRDARRRANELLDGFDLTAAAGRLVRTYSGGMRRRLDIAASLVTPPEVLFLDEPTTGLDPRSRHDVWGIVRGLTGAGTTVLLTTQYLAEADELADRIVVLDHGKLIADGTSGELKSSIGGGRLRVRVRDPQQRSAAQHTLSDALGTDVLLDSDAAGLAARTGDAGLAAAAVARLSDAGIAVSDFAHDQPTLDEVFFALTGTERGTPAGTGEERA